MKNLILLLLISFSSISLLSAQPPKSQPQRVSDVLQHIKGEWRQQYKIIDSTIVYDRRYLKTDRGMVLSIDTTTIHSFIIDDRGRTRYEINWDEGGQMKFDNANSKGSWDLKQAQSGGVDLIIRDAYYEGCPEVVRRILRINEHQLLMVDLQTGDEYYYTRR